VLKHGETEIKLTALRTPISNGALSADKLPARLKLANWGDNPSTKGNFRVTEHTVKVLPELQRSLGFGEIALDFEHNTVPGTTEYERTKEPRDVAAYGVPAVVRGDGLYLENLRWTPAGRAAALNFADLSPAVKADTAGNIEFIHSAALCRNGSVDGLTFYSVTISTPNQTKAPMTEKLIALSAIAGILNMDAASEETAVLAKLKERLNPPELTTLSALLNDGKVIIVDTVNDLAQRVKTIETANTKGIAVLSAKIDGKDVSFTAEDVVSLTARVKKLEEATTSAAASAIEAEKMNIIPLFAKEGRVPMNPATGKAYTADELKAESLPTLKVLAANTPVTVPLSARSKTASTEGKSNLTGLAKAIEAHKAECGQ
jgi:phage I-like protein